jgi:uracil-DNA glycosylase
VKRKPSAIVPKPKAKKEPLSPCVGCEYESRVCKVQPVLPPAPSLVIVGDAPDEAAEFALEPFSGACRDLVATALGRAGLDPGACAWVNLSRCRAAGDDLKGAPHQKAEKRCRKFLVPDMDRTGGSGIPLLLLGERALHGFWKEEGRKPSIGAYRGLWIEAKQVAPGRKAFVARHPRDIFADRNPEARRAEFFEDIRRMGESLNNPPLANITSQVYANAIEAREFLTWLAAREEPWAFDIEAYDAVEFPSRLGVSTDPCHQDFRLRGVAFSWGVNEGAYVDLMGWELDPVPVSELFTPVFASDAEKWAFGGHYDEEGVAYTKLAADGVRNRAGDGMLAMIALGDGTHDSLRLEKAVVDVLKRPQYWQGFDKAKMRDVPLADVADGAIGDACYTFELCTYLHERIRAEEYLRWNA